MEKQVIIRNDHELQASDYNNIQDWTTERIDHVVADGIDPNFKFTGFAVSISGAAEITLTPGRLYKAGMTYARDDAIVMQLISKLPLATKRIIAITGYGSENEDDVQTRDYLLDPENNVTEPRSVTMRQRRFANIGTIDGVEQPTPTRPVVDSTLLVIAWVTLTPAGVEAIEMEVSNYLPSVYGNHVRISSLENWRTTSGQRFDTIGSDISALASLITQQGGQANLTALMSDVARLKEISDLPDDYSDYGADRFFDDAESLKTDLNYLARIEEGVRFSKDAQNQTQLAVFNPLAANIKVSNNFVLPAHDESRRLYTGERAAELSVSQYQYQTHSMVQKTVARQRWRWGYYYNYWYPAYSSYIYRYDAVYWAYYRPGDPWSPLAAAYLSPWPYNYYWPYRYGGWWYDTVYITYWDKITTEHNVAGSQIAQTFLNSQNGWMTSLDLYFTRKAATGNVDIAVCEVTAGRPNVEALIARTTLAVADIKAGTDVVTNVPIPATYLEAGKRYALVITSPGDHYVATVEGSSYSEGTLFYSTDGAFYQGDLTKDLRFGLNFAKFRSPRIEVPFTPLTLSGGITDIDINADIVIPAATEFHWEVQTPDGQWHTLKEMTEPVLAGLPSLLQLRGVFVGTSDVMPGVQLSGSIVEVSRPRTALRHISKTQTLASPTQKLDVIVRTMGFNSSNHTLAIKVDLGAGLVAPASTTVRDLGNGIKEHVATYTATQLTTPMSTFKIDVQGTTTSALDTFVIAERIHVSKP
ncbi:MAG: hypothetical protein B7Y80_01460 [Hyphomicrobium sp. 32-62-53]|nr:MAG: hypothetical protein B7Z29_01810 [Hyphomicrobium sp. 12-62-95]OYY01422.1 MAG: hypothetical protein B7Y80_01460 [Hyphomicrobium sp. 32-62-53]